MHGLIEQEIERALEQLTQNGFTRRMPEETLQRRLEQFAERIATAARSETLLSIRSAEEAADAWGVGLRRAQAHIAALHARHGVGARIGRAWLITQDEIERHRPGRPGRRAGEETAMLNDAAKKLIARAARVAARESQDRARLGASIDALVAEAWRDATTQNPDFDTWPSAESYFETIFIGAIDA